MSTHETTPTGDAGHGHAAPEHNAFAHELLAADPAVHDVEPGEPSGEDGDVDDEDRFDAG